MFISKFLTQNVTSLYDRGDVKHKAFHVGNAKFGGWPLGPYGFFLWWDTSNNGDNHDANKSFAPNVDHGFRGLFTCHLPWSGLIFHLLFTDPCGTGWQWTRHGTSPKMPNPS